MVVLLVGLLADPAMASVLAGAAGAPPVSEQPIKAAASSRCHGQGGRRAGMRVIVPRVRGRRRTIGSTKVGYAEGAG
jgi:hypothetical protein